MSIDPAALLRALGSGVRPVGGDAPAAGPRLVEGPSFQGMLEQAQAGGLVSGIPMRVSRSAGVDLSPAQLTRLAEAADRAEAAGASRALAVIDGMVLQMDVGQRTITGKADLNATKVLNGVDAVVTVADAPGDIPGEAPQLNSGSMNASLLKVLGGRMPDQAA